VRIYRTRTNDSTFDLNLAPVLDIIVSIVPMLLLSVAFVQVKMIEAPTPQVVAEQTAQANPPKPETVISLRVSKKTGFAFDITDTKGKTTSTHVALAAAGLDYDGLLASAIKIKETYPEISRLQLVPDGDVAFDEIVKVMDQVRQKPRPKSVEPVSISDAAKAKPVETSYLFPDVIFSSIGG
jgi:biopolymer transport protein ExbD